MPDPLEQPPPDAPAPPPGEEATRSRAYMKGIVWLGVLSILGLAIMAYPVVFKTRGRGHEFIEALNNIRQIGLGLLDFEAEYGRFPDRSTIAAVKAQTGTKLTLDDSSSNMLFRQLIVAGLQSEKPFWARTPASRKKPDDVFTTDANTLARGECAFAYIAGLTSYGDPETPLVMTPMLKGQRKFDRSCFQGKAVILFLDHSARALPIEKDGRVLINGRDIFDPRQPFWRGKAPDLKWPE